MVKCGTTTTRTTKGFIHLSVPTVVNLIDCCKVSFTHERGKRDSTFSRNLENSHWICATEKVQFFWISKNQFFLNSHMKVDYYYKYLVCSFGSTFIDSDSDIEFCLSYHLNSDSDYNFDSVPKIDFCFSFDFDSNSDSYSDFEIDFCIRLASIPTPFWILNLSPKLIFVLALTRLTPIQKLTYALALYLNPIPILNLSPKFIFFSFNKTLTSIPKLTYALVLNLNLTPIPTPILNLSPKFIFALASTKLWLQHTKQIFLIENFKK